METERKLVEFLSSTIYSTIPQEPLETVRNMILAVLGTTIGGSSSEGCRALVDLYKEMGGREEATILVHRGRVPAQNAA